MKKIILDLCGGSGSWSRPYAENGYDVRIVTLPEMDVRLYRPPAGVHGVLCAPPCTIFSRARNRMGEPTDQEFMDGLAVVDACLRIVVVTGPKWWALENPAGKLKRWLGEPLLKFDPCDYGDDYTKRTFVWGRFNIPFYRRGPKLKTFMEKIADKEKSSALRSVTPAGFANAFFEVNR